ncbi:anaphase-promoting complex subunit 1 isoform X3 [Zea mays]|uniref:anaphase-promoting complex subunit 1 isoform X3 n=1 Tax=Zea mays TaxID=4577 RepID=UPI0009A951EB|nr:anaphase-promoting complex subunit 1 isoform X3 [Zea mays]|eukprot:XP_020395119.1 anaphase-promoting complex subunit 1 isoform X3 [Zea mays]
MASVGSRRLTVLREFRPHGLAVEEADGQGVPGAPPPQDYDYFLFDPALAISPTPDPSDEASSSGADGDHELFIRDNQIIWSNGSRVHKRYVSPNTVIMACWCRMNAISDALLCVLQVDTLSLYNVTGEIVCIPLPYAVSSIWPLPFGLLLQKSTDGGHMVSSSSSLLNARDLNRPSKEYGLTYNIPFQANILETDNKANGAIISSHLILKHPFEEPQATYVEEKDKLTMMRDFDEKTIWTSDVIPLIASYHKGKFQHSVWQIDGASYQEAMNENTMLPVDISSHKCAFRKIWQGKCSHSAASKVFLATDIDGMPIISFLLHEQKILLAVRIQVDDATEEAFGDIKPHMSWNIPAFAAAPVVVTRPRVRVGVLPFTDILVLSSDNDLLLYSGKQCLCRYTLPNELGKGFFSNHELNSDISDTYSDLKITSIADAVEGRINVTCSNGLMLRCSLRKNPSSSLVSDCITAMAEGLQSCFYNQFISLFWGSDAAYLYSSSQVDSEWEFFSHEIKRVCTKYGQTLSTKSLTFPSKAWDFLINSKYHSQYCKRALSSSNSFLPVSYNTGKTVFNSFLQDEHSSDVSYNIRFMRETLETLHALYENLKLNILRKEDLGCLASLLCTVASSLGEHSYVDYYCRDFPLNLTESPSLVSSNSLTTPPSLFRWFEYCLRHGLNSAKLEDIPTLMRKQKVSAVSWSRKVLSFYSLLLGAERKGKNLSSGVYCEVASGSARNTEELTVLAMVAEKFGHRQLDLLPVGVSLVLRHALDKCRDSPPDDWPATAYVLVGREDLATAKMGTVRKENLLWNNDNLTSMSVPYMLHLQPVIIPTTAPDIPASEVLNSDDSDSVYKSVEDGMEHIFTSTTQLRFGHDLRLNEVRRLLCSARPVPIQTPTNPSVSDQDLHQQQLWNFAQRTTALPFGRGAFTLATTYTLLTEVLVFPKLVLAGRLPAQQNATVNLDLSSRSVSEFKSWAEFHNGVAAGLRLAPFQEKMLRTWIQYNRPSEPNFTHAGLLLAFGLHEHLRVLTVTDAYGYLSQEHDITTLGLLLGLAASHRGTMDPAISKMLYFHVPSRHPSSTPELELPTLLQSAAVMGIGLLYEGSAHALTMKILLVIMGEIGRRSGGDNVLEREGYAVAAGSALGFVALGHGNRAFGFMDTFLDRLFEYIGTKEVYHEKYLNATSADDQSCNPGQMMDGAQINVDVTAPGAILALALIFLKAESEEIAARLNIPNTYFDLQYVRPDFVMLRIIARNLILWSRIQPTKGWVDSQIPETVRCGISNMSEGTIDSDELDAEALFQAYVNIVTGACIALGLKYAGSRNGDAQELLYAYTVYFLNEIKHIPVRTSNILPKGLLQYVDRGTLELCLHLIVLSLSLVSLAIGFLFLGGGTHTFSTQNSAIAALLISLYPRLPTGPNDNRCHLQAFRHLYVIATEPRWIQTVDIDTELPVYCPLEVTVAETDYYDETNYCEVTPCLLPERSVLKSIRVCGPRYWPQVIKLAPEDKPWWRSGDKTNPFNGGVLYIKRKVGSCSYSDDPIGCQSLISRAMHEVCDAPSASCSNQPNSTNGSYFRVDQLVSTFSANPSLIAFAKLCSVSWKSRCNSNFQEFCSQVLYECMSKDRPSLLQAYISFYTTIELMWEHLKTGNFPFYNSLFLPNLKVALAYNEALVDSRITNGGIIHSTFLESLMKRVGDIFAELPNLKDNLHRYLSTGTWPDTQNDVVVLSWYLQWYNIPPAHVVASAVEKVRPRVPAGVSMLPLLRLLLPTTHLVGLMEIEKVQIVMEC